MNIVAALDRSGHTGRCEKCDLQKCHLLFFNDPIKETEEQLLARLICMALPLDWWSYYSCQKLINRCVFLTVWKLPDKVTHSAEHSERCIFVISSTGQWHQLWVSLSVATAAPKTLRIHRFRAAFASVEPFRSAFAIQFDRADVSARCCFQRRPSRQTPSPGCALSTAAPRRVVVMQ